MTFDVFACGFQRGSGSIQLTTVYLENVPKTVIDLKAGFHIVPACGLGEPFGVVQQDFLAAYLDQQGWQAA